jgi:DUF1680 family protein
MRKALSRRHFLKAASVATAAFSAPHFWIPRVLSIPRAFADTPTAPPLEQFGYADVTLDSDLHEAQLRNTHAVLMSLSEDALLKPFRQMSGQSGPGDDLGGWYMYDPGELRKDGWGFAPTSTFGQWISALSRYYAITGYQPTREKILRLNRAYAQTISGDFYAKNRFPSYCYDKLVCGLIDSYRFAGDKDAFTILDRTTDAAVPQLPGHVVEHGTPWRPNKPVAWNWDEPYTLPENLFLACNLGAGNRYRDLAKQYLHETYFDKLANGDNDMAGRHAYSHVNALSSAMQAYLTLGSEKHLRAAKNGFDIVLRQSYATGGWGPDEQLRVVGSEDLFNSLTKTHNHFETPCGSYAHFKITRYLLRVTRDSTYGDSLERVMYNTALGAKPLEADGRAFYYSDYNVKGSKFYHDARWPCCSGTLPQVAADYRICAYFRDSDAIYVNLYVPSTVRWTRGDSQITLTQKSNYPFEGAVQFEVATSKPEEFAINLRIPAWAQQPAVTVNGKAVSGPVERGKFATIRRQWKTGDRIELEIPMRSRLEPINPWHPNTVALMSGPLVLFALPNSPRTLTEYDPTDHASKDHGATGVSPVHPATDARLSTLRAPELMAAKKIGPQRWQALTVAGPLDFVPFTAITDEAYTTYLNVT